LNFEDAFRISIQLVFSQPLYQQQIPVQPAQISKTNSEFPSKPLVPWSCVSCSRIVVSKIRDPVVSQLLPQTWYDHGTRGREFRIRFRDLFPHRPSKTSCVLSVYFLGHQASPLRDWGVPVRQKDGQPGPPPVVPQAHVVTFKWTVEYSSSWARYRPQGPETHKRGVAAGVHHKGCTPLAPTMQAGQNSWKRNNKRHHHHEEIVYAAVVLVNQHATKFARWSRSTF